MCNRLQVPRNTLVLNILVEHKGENRSISDWLELINKNLPTQYNFTKGSVAQVIGMLRRSGSVTLIKQVKNDNIYYLSEGKIING